MPSRSISDLHPELAYAFGLAEGRWEKLYPLEPKPFLVCTYRSPEEQNALYNQPTDKKDNDGDGKVDEPDEKVTNAKGGESPHNYLPALAFDIAFRNLPGNVDYTPRLFDQFAKLIAPANRPPIVVWGGHFKSMPDKPHFEHINWKKLAGKTK